MESDTSTEDEATEYAKKRKLANQGAIAFQKRLLDVVSSGSDDSSGDEDFLPTNIRRQILHTTKDENNVESIMSGMLFERMVNVYVTIVEGEKGGGSEASCMGGCVVALMRRRWQRGERLC